MSGMSGSGKPANRVLLSAKYAMVSGRKTRNSLICLLSSPPPGDSGRTLLIGFAMTGEGRPVSLIVEGGFPEGETPLYLADVHGRPYLYVLEEVIPAFFYLRDLANDQALREHAG